MLQLCSVHLFTIRIGDKRSRKDVILAYVLVIKTKLEKNGFHKDITCLRKCVLSNLEKGPSRHTEDVRTGLFKLFEVRLPKVKREPKFVL